MIIIKPRGENNDISPSGPKRKREAERALSRGTPVLCDS
jgi:hypothetical protein